MFKKNKNKKLTFLIASLMCASAISFSNVGAMKNIRPNNVIQRDYDNLMNSGEREYFSIAKKAKLLKKLIPDYINIMDEIMKDITKVDAMAIRDMRKGKTKMDRTIIKKAENILDKALNLYKQYILIPIAITCVGKVEENKDVVNQDDYKRDRLKLIDDLEEISASDMGIGNLHSKICEFKKFIYGDNSENQEKTTSLLNSFALRENMAETDLKILENEYINLKKRYANKMQNTLNSYIHKLLDEVRIENVKDTNLSAIFKNLKIKSQKFIMMTNKYMGEIPEA